MAVEPDPDIQTCPKCGAHGKHIPCYHVYTIDLLDTTVGLIDSGWQCFDCKHKWGFDLR